jgi:chromosome segregation ATPase
LTAAKIASWKLIAVKVKPFLETMPAFTDRHAEMERVITESEDLEIRQKQLKAELQELNHRRGELATQGEDLRARLAALIQAEHGFQSKLLIEFGVKPRQRRSRAKKLPGEQPTVTPQ